MSRQTVYIPRDQLRNFIESRNGRCMTVEFTKKDGSPRVLNGRIDVKAYQTGGQKTTDSRYMVFYEMPKPQEIGGSGRSKYRNVNLLTVERIRADGMDVRII